MIIVVIAFVHHYSIEDHADNGGPDFAQHFQPFFDQVIGCLARPGHDNGAIQYLAQYQAVADR